MAADVGRLGYANVYEAQLDTAGTVYFACQVGAHCTSGQKIAVAVERAHWIRRQCPV